MQRAEEAIPNPKRGPLSYFRPRACREMRFIKPSVIGTEGLSGLTGNFWKCSAPRNQGDVEGL